MKVMWFVLIATVSIVAGCSSVGAPDLVVPLETTAVGDWQLLVYDDSGLLTDARSAPVRPGDRQDGAIASPDGRELEINWTGGACSHRPTLQVTGSSTNLRLEMRNLSEPQLLPLACPAAGLRLQVTIELSEPVAQTAVAFEVRYSNE